MNNFNSYQKTMAERISLSKPETLMVMLYDGMITRLKQAKERFGAKQELKAKEAITRVMRIADALMDNLNHEDGGETAAKLEQLYFYVITELAQANREKEPMSHIENACRVLEILQQSWKQLEEKVIRES